MTQIVDIRDLVRCWMAWKSRTDGVEYQYKELAAAAGVSPSYLSNIMTGARNAGVKTIAGIAQAFGVDLAVFYAGPPENGAAPSSTPVGRTEDSVHPADTAEGTDKYGLALSRDPAKEIDKLFTSLGVKADDLFLDISLDGFAGGDTPDAPAAGDIDAGAVTHEGADDMPGIPVLERLPAGDTAPWQSGGGDMETVPVDFGLGGRRVFAVRVPDTSMMPDLRRGDLLIVDTDAPFEPGEGVIGIVPLGGRFMPRKIVPREDDFLAVPSNPAFLSASVPGDTRIFRIVLWLPAMNGKF